ncbi:MAG: phospholipase D family protein [Planctomycetota bacterium]|jgi:phosphatidylserine/phosphatidylglycerophosphate/cardiolipin synthase-like enzyme
MTLRVLQGEALHDEVVLRGILRAEEKVRIATAHAKNFTLGKGRARKSIVSELRRTARRGVRIEILHGAVPSEPFLHEIRTGEPFPPDRFELRFCPRVHLKLVIVDYATLYLGTANLTGAGLGARHPDSRNFEMGIITRSEAVLDEAMALFDRIWSGEACGGCLRRKDCPDPLESLTGQEAS